MSAFNLVVVQAEPPVLVVSAVLCPVHDHLHDEGHKVGVDDVVCLSKSAAAQPPPTEPTLYHYVEHLHLYSIDYVPAEVSSKLTVGKQSWCRALAITGSIQTASSWKEELIQLLKKFGYH